MHFFFSGIWGISCIFYKPIKINSVGNTIRGKLAALTFPGPFFLVPILGKTDLAALIKFIFSVPSCCVLNSEPSHDILYRRQPC